jgi:uncharacterized protein
MVLAFFVMFFISAAGEELGWSGFVLDIIQNRSSVVMAGLSLGIIWAIWHSGSFLQTGEPVNWVLW